MNDLRPFGEQLLGGLQLSRNEVFHGAQPSTNFGVRTGKFAPMVRNPLREAGANLGSTPVIKSYGCQALVSTVVSTVLQWFPLATCPLWL